MPSAGIQYQLVPNMMAYFTYNRGFLAGGFNAQNLLDTPEFIEYGPEHVNAYELGLKSTWLDQTLLLNVDLFRGNYTGLQVGTYVVDPSTQIGSLQVRNAASSISQGVELEMRWVISSEVRVSADITYLDSYYDSFKNGQPTTLQKYCTGLDLTQYTATPQCANFPFPVQANTFDRTGQQTSFAPRWSGSVTASHNTRLSHGYIFTTEFSPYFTSHYWSTDIPQDDFFSPYGSYVRLDARLGLESEDGRWQVALIGKNLTDRIIARQDFISTKSQPRNVAGQVLFKW